MRDEPLLEIARNLPQTFEGMMSIRGMHQKEVNRNGQAILKAIQNGLDLPKDQIPVLPEIKNYSTQPGVEELLAAYIQSRSEVLKIEPTVLADRKEIHEIVKCYEQTGELSGVRLLQGWRKGLIGETIKSILQGNICLYVDSAGKVSLSLKEKNDSYP